MTLRVISYGGGVQSTAMLALAAQGKLQEVMGGPIDAVLFANTGDDSEHPDTLKYVREIAMPFAKDNGLNLIELHTTKNGEPTTIWNEIMKPDSKRMLIPVYGDINMPLQRSCTVDFKIKTVGRWVKKNGAKKDDPAQVAIGISTDEIQRAGRGAEENMQQRVYPLLDLGISRTGCVNVITDSGIPVPPKSSCFFCPFHRPLVWAELRRDSPELFDKAQQLEDVMIAKQQARGKNPVYLTKFGKRLTDAIAIAQDTLFDNVDPNLEHGCDSGHCFT
jgi:hypothetical protein